MTEPRRRSEIETSTQAERIARLQARRSPATADRTSRRRSPAGTAKVLVAGASAAATLGMIAGFGIVDRLAAADLGATVTTEGPVSVPLVPTSSIAVSRVETSRPDVIVVVVDENGRVITTSADLDPAELTSLVPVGVPADGVTPAPPAAATQVTVPVAVPAPAAHPTAAVPAPAQATSGGS